MRTFAGLLYLCENVVSLSLYTKDISLYVSYFNTACKISIKGLHLIEMESIAFNKYRDISRLQIYL